MESEEFVKKVYESELEGPNRRGKPLGRWKDWVQEYLGERRRLLCHGHPLGGRFQRKRGVRALDIERVNGYEDPNSFHC